MGVWQRVGLGLVGVIVFAAGSVYALSEQRLSRDYDVPGWQGKVPVAPDAELLAHGKHVALTRGCLDCHRADGRGGLFADAGPVMRLVPSNITPAGVVKDYDDADWERTIRHCVKPDGTPVAFMPCLDNARLADDDLLPLIAYLRTLAPVADVQEPTSIGPVGRVLYLAGELPYAHAELIDHRRAVSDRAPTPGPTAAYGAYLVDACVGCHGEGLSGGKIPGVPPSWPNAANLTPDASGLASYDEAAFMKVMRTGVRPDGRVIDAQYMPWKTFAHFRDDELRALFAHLRTVPPRAAFGR